MRVASEDTVVDFQPDITHQVVAENKRKKHFFEKLYLEGRPPLNVGVTSGGDFFGGSQVALSDVLGDHNFAAHRDLAARVPELRGDLHRPLPAAALRGLRLRHHPFLLRLALRPAERLLAPGRLRHPALLGRPRRSPSTRSTSSAASSVNAGFVRVHEQFENADAEQVARAGGALQGVQYFLNNGTIAPLSVSLVEETTRFREFGPLSGHTYLPRRPSAPRAFGSCCRAGPWSGRAASTCASGAAPASCWPPGPRLPLLGRAPRHLLLRRQHGAAGLPLPLLRRQPGLLRQRWSSASP